jgi:hypothetical protein
LLDGPHQHADAHGDDSLPVFIGTDQVRAAVDIDQAIVIEIDAVFDLQLLHALHQLFGIVEGYSAP